MKKVLFFLISCSVFAENYLLIVNHDIQLDSAEFVTICGKSVNRQQALITKEAKFSRFLTVVTGDCDKLSYQLVGYSKNKVEKKILDINQVDTRYLKWNSSDYTNLSKNISATAEELKKIDSEILNVTQRLSAIKSDAITIVGVKELVDKKIKLKESLGQLESLNAQEETLKTQLNSITLIEDADNFENREINLNLALDSMRNERTRLKILHEQMVAEQERLEEEALIANQPSNMEDLERELYDLNQEDNFSNP